MTIRLLDPPLHEFLPEGDLDQIVGELTTDTGMTEDEVYARIEKLSEVNPMLGFRGCRFGIPYAFLISSWLKRNNFSTPPFIPWESFFLLLMRNYNVAQATK